MNRISWDEKKWKEIGREAKARWDQIPHPLDSLGAFETAVERLCQIQGSPEPPDITRRASVVFAADHGVVAEGVTQTGQDVTRLVAEELAGGNGVLNRFAGVAGSDVYVVDVGMNCEAYPDRTLGTGRVTDRKIRRGTRDLANEAAMTEEECIRAVAAGIGVCGELADRGYRILTAGEMGIGNTTPTAVLAASFLGMTAETVTGRGAGLDEEGFRRKVGAVNRALVRIRAEKRPPEEQTVEIEGIPVNARALAVLSEGGGLELAAMAGLYLGGMKYGLAVVIDGIISSVSALAASRLCPESVHWMFASHASSEPVALRIEEELHLSPVIRAGMHQGEGTGAVMLLPLLDMALAVYREMGSFESFGIEAYRRMDGEEEET